MNTKIYIILPVHNRREITAKFISSLAVQSYSNYHLILVDDGSSDGTSEMVQSAIPESTIIRGTGDWWWAGSLQQGIDWLKQNGVDDQDIILFMNDDVTFECDFLKIATNLLEQQKGMLLPQIKDEQTGLIQESGVDADFRRFTFKLAASPEKINCLSTRGLFMRMFELKKVGDFYPKLLPHYWSDYEFTIRAGKMGIRLATNPLLLLHANITMSGFRNFTTSSVIEFFRQYFSMKSVVNPIFTTIFILKTSPLKYIPINFLKIWRNAIFTIVRNLVLVFRRKINAMRVLKGIRHSHKDLKVIIGASSTKQEGWVSINYPQLDLTNYNTFATLFVPESVNNMLAEHVWEHLSIEDGAVACRNCFAFLKSGGVLRIAVPDGFHSDKDYIAQVKPGGTGPGAEDHKVLYNYKSLTDTLKQCGFKVKLLEYFDESGVFHESSWDINDGLIRRSSKFDPRNKINKLTYTSLIVDAIK